MRKDRSGKRGGRGGMALGRDLNLTETQRTQIQAIHTKYQPQHRALRDRAKPFLEAARTARQNWDSVAFRTNTERARQVMAGSATLRTQEQAEIRNLLTAEQRTKFDAHVKQMAERRSKMKSEGGRRRGPGRIRSTTGTIS
jgi:Spy/CpxP family protein refolding chaperone